MKCVVQLYIHFHANKAHFKLLMVFFRALSLKEANVIQIIFRLEKVLWSSISTLSTARRYLKEDT